MAACEPVQFAQRGLRLLEFTEDAARMGQEQLTRGRQFDPAADSIEKRQVQMNFELANLVRERGLGNVQFRGCLCKVRSLRHREEITKMPQLYQSEIHR